MDLTQIFILVGTIILVIMLEIVYIRTINIKKLIPINYLIIFLIFFVPILSTTVYILYSNNITPPPTTPPPTKTCPNNCSGNGTCNTNTGKCTCEPNFTGDDCSTSTGAGGVICGIGFYNDNNICKQCGAGTYQDETGKTSCKQCAIGTYQDATGQASCKQCGKGTYNSKTGSISSSDCLACGTGTYQDTQGQSSCKKCGTGTYNSKTGSTTSSDCLACGAGTYQDETGKTSCKQCAIGTYQDATGQASCKQCGKGTYNSKTGSISSSDCLACGTGTYQDTQGQSSCKKCDTGTYNSKTGSTTSSDCLACGAGTYQDATGQSVCKQCGVGTYQDATGQSVCKQCGAGTYNSKTGSIVTSDCVACGIGTYQDAIGQSSCKKCPGGTYQNTVGQTSCKNLEDIPGSALGAGEIIGIVIGVIVFIAGVFFVTRNFGSTPASRKYSLPQETSDLNSQLEQIRQGGRICKIQKTLEQGDCFYSSIYRSAYVNNLLNKISTSLDIQFNDEKEFIQQIRNKIAESSYIRNSYYTIYDSILKGHGLNYKAMPDSYLGDPMKDVLKPNIDNIFKTEGSDEYSFSNVFKGIKEVIKTMESYVGVQEIDAAEKIFKKIGIQIIIHESEGACSTAYHNTYIQLYYNKINHYKYFY